jgi:hypothetical protein
VNWATRQGVHIDRAACAWLIRRHVDPDATFVFVADPADVPPDATLFDMPGVDLSHHGPDCTFETLLRRHDLTDPVLWRIAALVDMGPVLNLLMKVPYRFVRGGIIAEGMRRTLDNLAVRSTAGF